MRKLSFIDWILGITLVIMIIFMFISINNSIQEILTKIHLQNFNFAISSIFVLILTILYAYFYERWSK
jgi:sterol desaturase/sphingolipid hydroxylase (fatty acid hydroxylase superfamily)